MTDAPDRLEEIAVEAVARAIHAARGKGYPWWHEDADKCRHSRELATTALATILALPDPRIAELEARVARLEGALRKIAEAPDPGDSHSFWILQIRDTQAAAQAARAGDAP